MKKLGPIRPSVRILDDTGELRPLAEIEADIIRDAIEHYGRRSAARVLQIGRSTIYRKLPTKLARAS